MSNNEISLFFYPLSEPPEAKHVRRLTWIKIQTQTERNWDFPSELEKNIFTFSPDLLVFSHWHSDIIMLVLRLWDFCSIFLSHTCKTFGEDETLSTRKTKLSRGVKRSRKWRMRNIWADGKLDSFIAMFCIGIQVAARLSYANWKTRWKLISIFNTFGARVHPPVSWCTATNFDDHNS